MFPFLIGKVLTMKFGKTEDLPAFPFLIGKVLTKYFLEMLCKNIARSFPFLIGKVLTTAFKPL